MTLNPNKLGLAALVTTAIYQLIQLILIFGLSMYYGMGAGTLGIGLIGMFVNLGASYLFAYVLAYSYNFFLNK